jgi:hypothetical protein
MQQFDLLGSSTYCRVGFTAQLLPTNRARAPKGSKVLLYRNFRRGRRLDSSLDHLPL